MHVCTYINVFLLLMVSTRNRGTTGFKRARLPGRENFASDLDVGHFFVCSLTNVIDEQTTESIVLLREIHSDDDDDECVVVVSVLNEAGVDEYSRPVLIMSDEVLSLSPFSICHPVHVVPQCARGGPSSWCTINAIKPPPHVFTFACFALNGNHTATQKFVLNPYLVK